MSRVRGQRGLHSKTLSRKNKTQNKQKPLVEVSIQVGCLSQPLIGAICGHSGREEGVGAEVRSNQARIPGAGAGLRGFASSRVFVSRHLSAWSVS